MTYPNRADFVEAVLPFVGPLSRWGTHADDLSAASATWESIDRAVYMPIWVPVACTARRVFWVNGATVTGGATIEVGLYKDSNYKPAGKLFSGSALQGTLNQVQFVTITATLVTPGRWWVAITSDIATNTTLFAKAVAGSQDAIFRFEQATARPLPASATAVEASAGNLWMCGFSTTTIA